MTKTKEKDLWELINPTGISVHTDSIPILAKKLYPMDLDEQRSFVNGIHDVKRGRKKHHRGWTLAKKSKESFRPLLKIGTVFGRLKIVKGHKRNDFGNYLYKCKCVCGNVIYLPATRLKIGDTVSCGCKRKGM